MVVHLELVVFLELVEKIGLLPLLSLGVPVVRRW